MLCSQVGEPEIRKLLTILAIHEVDSINTEEFTSLIDGSVDKFIEMDLSEQKDILDKCCTFKKTTEYKHKLCEYKFDTTPVDVVTETDKFIIDKQIRTLESRLKYSRNYMERARLSKQIALLRRQKK